LEAAVICPSTSPYSLLVLMVLKKEWTWRMCHNFQALNKLIVKEKFPIPIIGDILDEIHGPNFFTKLDLHYGYHQIKMKEVYIPNITFRTHEGHYEFQVMPFILCNSPSTFQSLTNKIFKPFLHNFMLVFFDYILIYNKIWKSHIAFW
jgi:hypothetical protein